MDLPPEILCHIFQHTTDAITLSRLLQTNSSTEPFLRRCVHTLSIEPQNWIDVPISFISQFTYLRVITFPIVLRSLDEFEVMATLPYLFSATFINETSKSLPALVKKFIKLYTSGLTVINDQVDKLDRDLWPSDFLFVDERTKTLIATSSWHHENLLILSEIRDDYSLSIDELPNTQELSEFLEYTFNYTNITALLIDLRDLPYQLLDTIRFEAPAELCIYATTAGPFEILFEVTRNFVILSESQFYDLQLSIYLDDLNQQYPHIINLLGLFNLDDISTIIHLFPNLQTLGIYTDFTNPNHIIDTINRLPSRITRIIIYTSNNNIQLSPNYFPNRRVDKFPDEELFLDYRTILQYYARFNDWLL